MRSFWSGEIAFGLVTIPAKLYTATHDSRPRFHLLHKECGTPIETVRRCPKHHRDLAWNEIGKGYEVSKGKYVLFTPEELAKLDDDETPGTIEIVAFVHPEEVDLAYIEQSYWVGPGGKNLRGYDLLRRVLEQTKRVAIAKAKLRTRTRLGLLRPRGRLYALDMMRFAEELVPADDIEPAEGKPATRREIELATHLVDALSAPFNPSKQPDEYRSAVLSAVEAKVEAGEAKRGKRANEADGERPSGRGPHLVDLTSLLAQSLKGANDHPPRRAVHANRGDHPSKGTPVKAERPAVPARKKRKTG